MIFVPGKVEEVYSVFWRFFDLELSMSLLRTDIQLCRGRWMHSTKKLLSNLWFPFHRKPLPDNKNCSKTNREISKSDNLLLHVMLKLRKISFGIKTKNSALPFFLFTDIFYINFSQRTT